MNQFEKMKLGGASASVLQGSASANIAVYPTSSSKSATSLASKVVFLMLTLVLALTLSAGSAYASSDSNSDNDADVSDDATMIYKSSFKDDKSYTIEAAGTYKLAEDIEDGHINVHDNIDGGLITLDLNGHTLTNKTKDTQAIFFLVEESSTDQGETRVSLEVTNSENEGAIIEDKAAENTAIRIDSKSYSPEVTLNKVKIVSNASECIASYNCQLTINDATLQTALGTEASLIYAKTTGYTVSTITINSGSFSIDADSVFKLEENDFGEWPYVTSNGGTYNKAPIGGYLGEDKSIWKTNDGYVVGDTSDKPSECKYPVVLSESETPWFCSEEEAKSFADSYASSSKTTVHKISFTSESGKPSVDIPVQYVADGYCAIKPDVASPLDGYEFNGWKNGNYTYDFEDEVTEDLTLTADWSFYVAQVGEKKFTSVEDAITNSSSGDTVKLIQDIEGQINVTHTHEVTLDLNGHTVTSNTKEDATVIDRSSSTAGWLTITDSAPDWKKGKISQEAEDTGAIRLNDGSPSLKLNGVTVKAFKGECLQVPVYTANVELTDVVMSTTQKANSLIYTRILNGNGAVVINSGTYTAADGATKITEVAEGSETILNGGSFNIFPADGKLSGGKVLFKAADPDEAKGYFEVVDSDDVARSSANAEVKYSGATIYFANATEAATFAKDHEDEGAICKTLVSAKITEPKNLVYDGAAKEVAVNLTGIDEDDKDKVSAVLEYEYPDGTKSSEAPVNAGKYTVTATGLQGDQASKYELKKLTSIPFTVEKAKATIQVNEPGEKTVNESFNLGATVKIDPGIEGEKPALAYESSNEEVAEVDENGLVEALAEGTATLTVKIAENGNFTADSQQVSLTVKAAPSPSPEPTPTPTPVVTDISKAKVTLSKTAFTYNGKAQKPSVKSVVLNGKTLRSDTDYTASIASGKKVGTYKVTINAKGSSYKGKTTASFVVNPKGVTKFKVSKAKKAFKVKWTKNKTERSGVQIRYFTKKSMAGAKTVKAKGASVKAKKVKKLKKKTKYYVQARSYKVVNGKTYYSSWSAKKAVKTK